MRQISADLTTVQALRSPKAAITITVANRGLAPPIGSLAWTVYRTPGAKPVLARGGAFFASDNTLLILQGDNNSLTYHHFTDPTYAPQWNTINWTEAVAEDANSIHAINHATNKIRVYFTNSATGNVRRFDITNTAGSISIGGVSTTYSLTAAADMIYTRHPSGSHNLFPFDIRAYSDYVGGVWSAYLHGNKYADNWRAAGIISDPDDLDNIYLLVFRAADHGPSRFRIVKWNGSSFSDPHDIDQSQGGLFGLSLYGLKLFTRTARDNNYFGLALETAYMGGVYEGLTALWQQDSEFVMDEPLIPFPDQNHYNDQIYNALTYNPADQNWYYHGQGFAYRGQPQTATGDTLTPSHYIYDNHHITITLPASTPAIQIGQILTVKRTLSWGAATGNEDLAFYVTSVHAGKRHTIIDAVDAVGYLGISRQHRPFVANDGSVAGLSTLMRRLCARCGLDLAIDDSGLDTAAVIPMTIQPSESLLGAAYRARNQANAWLVPANNGTFALTLINPGTSDSGDYDDSAHTYPDGQWTLIDAAAITDLPALGFAYVLGTYSTDPEDGSYVAMAAGPSTPNARPIPYSVTNTRYNSDTRVANAADTEADRQKKLNIDALIEAPANLALEIYDIVQITDSDRGWSAQPFRVRNIIETWDHGRLTQTLHLGTES
ncbi:hypothetical protein LCGC14_0759740 [marine sediment metagenome]|uniref:Uncharacterized protein n=1 Tax=marine sediment metagenome TaxID=412755 RepID=A0A0F9Q5L7_9ZZZZ